MKLKQNQEYGTLCIDFYEDSKRDIFITIDQLAEGLDIRAVKG